MTNVDACEQDKSTCWNVNVKAVEIITEACRLTDTHLIHYSSDYIFDGREGPYPEAASPNPINYYGKSKLAAENICIGAQIAHTILRTNVLYGFSQDRKQHFVEWVLHKLRQEQPFKVVDDQFSNPTLTDDIAIATLRIIQRNTKGIINVAGQTWHSRFDFAKIIAEVFGLEANFEPMKTADLGQAAARPLRGGLQSDRLQLLLGFRTADSLAGVHTYRQQLKMFGQWSPDFQ
jgi:dTDP-4-dehydrorhamnose reductase